MAIAPRVASAIFGGVLGRISAGRGKYDTDGGLDRLIKDTWVKLGGVGSGFNYSQVAAVVRQANAAWEAGQLFQSGGAAPTPPKTTTIPATDLRYEYRVLVSGHDERGRSHTTVVVLRSDSPMSYDQLKSEALDVLNNTTPSAFDSNGRRGITDTTAATVTVLSAAGR